MVRIGIGLGSSVRGNAVANLGALLFSESLVSRALDGRAVAHLVSGWQWEDGGKTLRLRLKSDVRLHDGALLTAGMVADIIRRSRLTGSLGFEYLTGVVAPDPRSIVVSLSRPDFFLLPELTLLKIVRPEAPDIGTGPFKITAKEPVFQTVVFDRYHGGTPGVTGVTIVPYDTQRGAWAGLMRDEVDAVQEVSRETVEFVDSSRHVETYPSLQPYYIPLLFNHHHAALARRDVRLALRDAVDREAIVEAAMRGHGRVADDPIWPLHWAHPSRGMRLAYDPAGAMRRLDLAGLPLPARAARDGTRTRLTLRCLFWGEDAQYERIALILQRQLFDVGINLVLTPADMTTITQRVQAGDFDTALIRVNSGRSLDYTYRFWHTKRPESLVRGYTGVDRLLEDLRSSTDDARTQAAIAALVRRFYEDAPAIFIAWAQVTRAIDRQFSVGELNSQDPLAAIWQWRPVTGGPQ